MAERKEVTFNKDTIIFKQGDESDGLYFIRKGSVTVYYVKDDLEIVLANIAPGQVLGVNGTFTQSKRMASAKADNEVVADFYPGFFLVEKTDPVSKAIIKDCIYQVQTIDKLLISYRMKERENRHKFYSSATTASQLAAFLGVMLKVGCVDDEGGVYFPLRGFIAQAEMILFRPADHLEKIFKLFVSSGLIILENEKKYGDVLKQPDIGLVNDFAAESHKVAAHPNLIRDFIPYKYHFWVKALIRIRKKYSDIDEFPKEQLQDVLEKDTGRQVKEDLFDRLLDCHVISRSRNLKSFIFNIETLRKKLIFETIMKDLEELDESEFNDYKNYIK